MWDHCFYHDVDIFEISALRYNVFRPLLLWSFSHFLCNVITLFHVPWFNNVMQLPHLMFSWTKNTDNVTKKAYSMRKLSSFHVNTHLQIFYSSVICSVLIFGLTCWGGHMTEFNKRRWGRFIRKSDGLNRKSQSSYDTIFEQSWSKELIKHHWQWVTPTSHWHWPSKDC